MECQPCCSQMPIAGHSGHLEILGGLSEHKALRPRPGVIFLGVWAGGGPALSLHLCAPPLCQSHAGLCPEGPPPSDQQGACSSVKTCWLGRCHRSAVTAGFGCTDMAVGERPAQGALCRPRRQHPHTHPPSSAWLSTGVATLSPHIGANCLLLGMAGR